MNNEFMQLLPLQAFYLMPVRSMALSLLRIATSPENAVIAGKAASHPLPRLRKARAALPMTEMMDVRRSIGSARNTFSTI